MLRRRVSCAAMHRSHHVVYLLMILKDMQRLYNSGHDSERKCDNGAASCVKLSIFMGSFKLQGDVGLTMKRPHRHSRRQAPTYLSVASPRLLLQHHCHYRQCSFKLSTNFAGFPCPSSDTLAATPQHHNGQGSHPTSRRSRPPGATHHTPPTR